MARTTPHSLQLHRVPAGLLRARTAAHFTEIGGWSATAVRLLHAVAPEDPWNNPPVWPVWRQLLPHTLAVTDPSRRLDPVADELSWLLHRAAIYLMARGELRAARPVLKRTHELNRLRLGDDHPNTLSAASNLAYDLRRLGEYEQARQLNQDTLDRYRRVLGEDHPDTLASVADLAADLRELGKYEQARQLGQDTLDRRRRVLGEDHPDTLASATNFAADLRWLGEYKQAHQPDQD